MHGSFCGRNDLSRFQILECPAPSHTHTHISLIKFALCCACTAVDAASDADSSSSDDDEAASHVSNVITAADVSVRPHV